MEAIDRLAAIAEAIRAKTGKSEKLTLTQMAEEITNIGSMPEAPACPSCGGGSFKNVEAVYPSLSELTLTGAHVVTYTCMECGHTWEEEIPVVQNGDKYVPTEEKAFVVYNKKRSCEENGLTLYAVYTPALCCEHEYESVVTPPYCSTDGYTTHTCTRCGHSYTSDPVPMLNGNSHKFKSQKVTATCTEPGYTRTYCTVCGFERITPIEPYGHAHQALTVPPSCEVDGYIRYTCPCGDTYEEVLPSPGGHKYESEHWPATCEDFGCTVHTCVNCGYYYFTDIEDPYGHKHTKTSFEPTCVDEGGFLYECDCGDVYFEVTDEPLGHVFVNGACTRCGASE